MIVHFGISPSAGYCWYFDESKRNSIKLKTKPVNFNEIEKVPLMFEEIKSKINEKKPFFRFFHARVTQKTPIFDGKLGYACIYLYKNYGNEIRKKFIECGLKCGFKNIEIINRETAIYLNAMSQMKYKPLNGNVIWIQYFQYFLVWEINNQKAKFFGMWEAEKFYFLSKLNELRKIVDESKLNKGPDIVLYMQKDFKSKLRKISAFQCFYTIYDYWWYPKGSLLKARITARDPGLTHLETTCFLSRTFTLKIGNNFITSFEEKQQLPIFYTKSIIKNTKNDTLKVDDSPFELPDYSPIFLTFTIDRNEIFSVTFDKSKNVKTLSSYSIPKVQAPFNIEKNVIGIDLGTSRCCVAVNRKNGITTVALEDTGERLLPSYVSYDEKNVKCGQIVVKRLRNFSKSTVFDSKRIIGRSLSNIEIDIFWPFGIFEKSSKVCLEVEKFSGKATVFPEEVAAELLKHIKQKAEEFQGKPLSKAVITVPAAFNEAQKNATLEAATIAGWKEIILLPEPIAAAFAYINDRPIPDNSNVLLFDLGGGTLDVCIFKIQNNQIEIISNTGDSKFGGRDFDTVLINYFKNALCIKYGISFVKNKKYLLMVKCQKIKETLSVMVNASLDVDDFDPTQEGNIQISQEGFQKMCELLLNKVKNTLNAALHNSNFNSNQINKVLHVGGGSRMPMIKQLLRNMFPEAEHCIEEHPDEVVAIGAAYYAYNLFSDS